MISWGRPSRCLARRIARRWAPCGRWLGLWRLPAAIGRGAGIISGWFRISALTVATVAIVSAPRLRACRAAPIKQL